MFFGLPVGIYLQDLVVLLQNKRFLPSPHNRAENSGHTQATSPPRPNACSLIQELPVVAFAARAIKY